MGSVPGLGRSPGGGRGNPLQSSCLGDPVRGDWREVVRRVAESQIQWRPWAQHSKWSPRVRSPECRGRALYLMHQLWAAAMGQARRVKG